MDESDDDKLGNQDILATTGAEAKEESENDDDLEEERELQRIIKE